MLLAGNFVFQKKYQKTAGASIKSGVIYNALTGIFSTLIFLIINRFKIDIEPYSCVMAAVFSTALMAYMFIGFKIMENGNMSLYTLFLMTGGMTVPYLWGILFLDEEITTARIIGVVIIITAVVIFNSGGKKPDRKQLLMCVAVFFLNGITSVTSKMHQVSSASEVVSSPEFACMVMMFKAVICIAALVIFKNELCISRTNAKKIKSILPIVIFASVFDGLSYMLQLIGAESLPASVLYPFITGGSIILTSFAGVAVFKEKLTIRQWLAVAACFVGTLLFL